MEKDIEMGKQQRYIQNILYAYLPKRNYDSETTIESKRTLYQGYTHQKFVGFISVGLIIAIGKVSKA